MVLNRRIADTSFLARPRFKIKQTIMEPVSVGVSGMRNNKTTSSRWSSLVSGTSTGNGNVINASIASSSGGNGVPVTIASSTQPTTHQKVRRILEDHAIWEERGNGHRGTRTRGPSGTSSSSTSTANVRHLGNYNIVASRGELSRNSFYVRETPTITTRKNRLDEKNDFFENESEDYPKFGKSPNRLQVHHNGRDSRTKIQQSQSNWEKRAACRENDRSTSRSRNLSKSSSIPANLISVTGSSGTLNDATIVEGTSGIKVTDEGGILRKSSAFLASLTHSGLKNLNDRRNNGIGNVSRSGRKNVEEIADWTDCDRKVAKPRFSLLRRNAPTVTNRIVETTTGLRKSPSCQSLNNAVRKKSLTRGGVKKSVSFSSDTSFEEKRAPFKKTAVHEAKVYRKGVLREINASDNPLKKVSATWESPPGDPKALLRASREADDPDLDDLVSRIRRSGLGQMEINATDSSGRTAISYMAGNGATAMLEATLSFIGSDPNLPDNEGNTPLHFAAQAGQTECLNMLLQKCSGIEVDARNILGFTPLMKAALQGRTKCAKILLFAGANPTLRDHGRGLRAEQWARYCGRYVCAEVIERFARHRLLDKNSACRWGSEPELATKVLQGKVVPVPAHPVPPPSTGFRSKIKRVFRTSSGPDRSFSLVSQLTSAALCASTPALPKPGDISTSVKSLIRPLSVPQLRVTPAAPLETIERTTDKYGLNFTDKIESAITKPPRSKKKNK